MVEPYLQNSIVNILAEIRTVLGPMDPTKLGVTSFQERMILSLPGWEHSPEAHSIFNRADAYDKLERNLLAYKKVGGQSIVDGTGITGGRDVNFLALLSKKTGINIVASTGFLEERFIPGHFFPERGRDEEYLAKLFLNELNKGAATSGMISSDIKPGLICIRSSPTNPTDMELTALKGAARAAKRSGSSVLADSSSDAQKQLGLLLNEGIEPRHVVISLHGNVNEVRQQIKSIAPRGVFVAFDHIGWDQIDDTILSVSYAIENKLVDRILLGSNSVGVPIGADGSHHSLEFLLKEFMPKLRDSGGVSKKDADTMLIDNPRTVLSFP